MPEEKEQKTSPPEKVPPKKEPKLVTPRPTPTTDPSVSHHSKKPKENQIQRPQNTVSPSESIKAYYLEDPPAPKDQSERPKPTTNQSTSTKEQGSSKKDK